MKALCLLFRANFSESEIKTNGGKFCYKPNPIYLFSNVWYLTFEIIASKKGAYLMGRNAIETVLGAVVLAVAGLFMVFAYSSADLQKVQGYNVSAYFPMVDGVKDGTDVKINGVKVGSVSGLSLITTPGANQFKVNMKMTIMPHITLPVDTIAMIASESLLGGKYVSLEVGVDEETIKTDGTGRITRTQSPMRLDDLIGQLIYSSRKSDNTSSGVSSAATTAPAPTPTSPAVGKAPEPAHP